MKTIQNEAKEQKGGFLGMLLVTLDASLLGNTFADRGKKSIPPHPLTNFEIQIIRINLSLMEFILEIIYLIK